MKGSKLLDVIELFTTKELDELEYFLQSPAKKNAKHQFAISKLLKYIRSEQDLQKDAVFEHLFPSEKFTKSKLDKLMSALLKQIQTFINVSFGIESNSSLQEMITMVDFFHKRQAKDKELSYLERAKKAVSKSVEKDKNFFYESFLINEQVIRRDYLLQDKQIGGFDFHSISHPLDIYYLLNKLEYACFFLSMDRFRKPVNIKGIIEFLDAIKPIYVSSGVLKMPLIKLYYQAFDLLKNLDEADYWTLKKMIAAHEASIPKNSIRIFISIIRNYIARQYNHGEKHLANEFFEINKTHLNQGYLTIGKGILPTTFINMVTIGLNVKAFDWVFQFLNDYRYKIVGAKNAKNVYQYNLAAYHFACQQYEEALKLLKDNYEDLFYKISAKRLELKIYYEIKSPILESRMDAFKIYIYRLPKSFILEHQRSNENNFINFLRRLHNPKTAISEKRIDRLVQKMISTKLLTEKKWLLEKANELKK